MKKIGVIPARLAATRFPGKVLAELHGKPLIQYVWQQVQKAKNLDEVIIACDDEKVVEACEAFGAKAVMTSVDHASGTDRIAETVKDKDADIVVNIQGDEPMISPHVIDDLASALESDPECLMATVIKRIRDVREALNPNVVKVVIDVNGYALYFSRHTIPFNRDEKEFEEVTLYKHFGIYAYRRDFLLKFHELPASLLEQTERLEQLRVLEAGYKIKTIMTDQHTVGVDTPDDLDRVAQLLTGEANG